MLETQNSFPSRNLYQEAQAKASNRTWPSPQPHRAGPSLGDQTDTGKGKGSPAAQRRWQVCSLPKPQYYGHRTSTLPGPLLTPPQEPLPPAAAVSCTYPAQRQPLPVTLGKMQEEVERPLGVTHNGIHNLFQQKSRHREFVSKPTTTII